MGPPRQRRALQPRSVAEFAFQAKQQWAAHRAAHGTHSLFELMGQVLLLRFSRGLSEGIGLCLRCCYDVQRVSRC